MTDVESAQLREWAIKGAEHRLSEIAKEAAAIHRAFPELRGRANGIAGWSGDRSAAIAKAATRRGRRRTMSADARRRISEAQKRRWAERRGEGPGASSNAPQRNATMGMRRRGARKMSAAARKRISDAQKARWAKLRK